MSGHTIKFNTFKKPIDFYKMKNSKATFEFAKDDKRLISLVK